MPTPAEVDKLRWEHMKHFAIPLPPAFFNAIFWKRTFKKKDYYAPIKWAFDVGDTIHLHPESYRANYDALPLDTAVLIQVVFTERRAPDRDLGPLHFDVYQVKPDRSGYEVMKRIHTVQGAFLEFIKTYDWSIFDQPIRDNYWPAFNGPTASIEMTLSVEYVTEESE